MSDPLMEIRPATVLRVDVVDAGGEDAYAVMLVTPKGGVLFGTDLTFSESCDMGVGEGCFHGVPVHVDGVPYYDPAESRAA